MDKIQTLALRICAGRATLDSDDFVTILQELIRECERAVPFTGPVVLDTQPHCDDPNCALRKGHVGEHQTIAKWAAKNLGQDGPIKQIVPMRTKDEAMDTYRKNHPEGVPKRPEWTPAKTEPPKSPLITMQSLGNRRGPLTDADKDKIRERYKAARVGKVRVERGWVQHIAREYDVSASYVYNIIYTDPTYEAVPRS